MVEEDPIKVPLRALFQTRAGTWVEPPTFRKPIGFQARADTWVEPPTFRKPFHNVIV